MKRNLFLIGILLPFFANCQNSDSSMHKKLTTTAPLLGGIIITNILTTAGANGNNFMMQQPIAEVGIPVYKNFRTPHAVLIKSGIRYQGLFLSRGSAIGVRAFHSITLPVLVNYSLSRATNISFVGLATVGSDFKRSIDPGDIQYTTGIRVGFRSGKAFKYGVTLTYTRNYSGTFLLPIPDIDWIINNKLTLTGIIPIRASLKYKLSKIQSLGITTTIGGGSMYRLNEDATSQYIHLQQSSAGLIYDLKIRQRWKFNIIGGHTFSQKLQTFNSNQRVPFEGFGKLNDRLPNVSYRHNSFLFQGGISYEF